MLLAWLACADPLESAVPTSPAQRGTFEARLLLSGELSAVRSEYVNAPNVRGSLKVASVVDEGVRVKKGDVLVEFDRAEFERELETQRSRLEIARTKMAQTRAQLDVRLAAAQSGVTNAELDLRRAQMRITDSETVPRVERETARIDAEGATLALARAHADLASTKLEGEAQIELLRLEEGEATTKYETALAQLDQLTLRAPSDGLVILVEAWRAGKQGKVTAGDTVWSGNPLMELPDLSSMEVDARVHEVDAPRVKVGQTAKITVEAFPDAPVGAKVERIGDLAVAENEGAAKMLDVVLALDTLSPDLKPGMSVRVDLLVESVPDAVSVPREAVWFDGAEAYVRIGGERTPVKLGATNDTHVVVKEGLAGGEVVELQAPDE